MRTQYPERLSPGPVSPRSILWSITTFRSAATTRTWRGRKAAELTDLKDEELAARMRAHADRVTQLLAMHERMMGR